MILSYLQFFPSLFELWEIEEKGEEGARYVCMLKEGVHNIKRFQNNFSRSRK